MRGTALLAILTGLISLSAILALTWLRTQSDMSNLEADAQLTFRHYLTRLIESRPYGAVIQLALIGAGVFLWRGARMALPVIGLGCGLLLARYVQLGIQAPNVQTWLYLLPTCAWLAFVLYRSWKTYRQFAPAASPLTPPAP